MTAFFRRTSFGQWAGGRLIARACPIRFACVGGTSAVLQLALLHILTGHGWNAIVAEIVAFFVSAQVNFLLHINITWRAWRATTTRQTLGRCWLAFHGSIAGTALLNLSVFTVAHLVLPALYAAALGIIAAAVVNFVTLDRLVFRPIPAEAA